MDNKFGLLMWLVIFDFKYKCVNKELVWVNCIC